MDWSIILQQYMGDGGGSSIVSASDPMRSLENGASVSVSKLDWGELCNVSRLCASERASERVCVCLCVCVFVFVLYYVISSPIASSLCLVSLYCALLVLDSVGPLFLFNQRADYLSQPW